MKTPISIMHPVFDLLVLQCSNSHATGDQQEFREIRV